jgi:hypothetical protein
MTPLDALDRRALAVIVAVALVPAAIFGYLVGHGHASAPVREQSLTTSAANVLLQVPVHWQAVSSAPPVPGLSLAHAVALAPRGNATQSGLVAGALPAGEPGPLPAGFLARMTSLPATAVVGLQEVQAYQYTSIKIAGYRQTLAVYVVPNPGGQPTGLACYASPAAASDLRACEHIVATLTLAGGPRSLDLTPEPAYAAALSGVVSHLDVLRAGLRHRMAPGSSPRSVHDLALQLAGGFAQAASSVSVLQATLATSQAQAALSATLQRARSAYAGLASAAGQGSEAAFASARAQVDEAERGVDRALETFGLLGYRQ